MPRRFIRRYLPDIDKLLAKPSMAWARSIAADPNLLHLNRHSVSLAVAIGIFCAFIPVPGQTLIAIFLCYQLRANLVLGVVFIWISNPITIPPMFYLTYQLGALILGTEPLTLTVELDWQWFKNLGTEILMPLFLGSLLCAAIFSVAGYFTILYLWRWQVIKNWERRNQARRKQ